MQFSTLFALYSTVFAAATTSPDVSATSSATSTALETSNLNAALELASSSEVKNEKRGALLGLVAAKYTWCSALLNQGICYSCGSSDLGCSSSCCRCGATTQISCSTC